MKKKNAFLTVLYLAPALHLAAQSLLPSGMSSLMDSVLEVFTGGFVKTILIIFLVGCAVAYGFNKDNEKMKRNIIAIGVAIAIIGTASFIVEKIWDASKG
jgi:type IV secretory pathway VirB2 component (pilin)